VLAEPVDQAAPVPCKGEKEPKDQPLFHFAVSRAGAPTACEARRSAATDESHFREVVYRFKDGSNYTVKTSPPETSVVTLTTTHGFSNEAEAMKQLKGATAKVGLQVKWVQPEIEKAGSMERKTFWDPAEGTNGRGFLTYENGTLVSIGFGMAL